MSSILSDLGVMLLQLCFTMRKHSLIKESMCRCEDHIVQRLHENMIALISDCNTKVCH